MIIMDYWVAVEDADTHEVTDFESASIDQVLSLLDSYRVDMDDCTSIQVCNDEDGSSYVYTGVAYKGGFGINVWVTEKYNRL